MPDLILLPVNELLNKSFSIPAYQRGYRWTPRQVTELLDDVFTFQSRPKTAVDSFYCLQPVVVTRNNIEKPWELIDGQQRLTTIFLILSYFNCRLTVEHRKKLFSLVYVTHEDSAEYLQTLNESRSDENIDFSHIWQAYQAIHEWFKDKANWINVMESAFLNSVKVIWYEVNSNVVDPIAVFTRLNMGKIPLTNAELVKALFLKEGNFEKEGERVRQIQQLKIAQEWDEIERRLHDDSFWFFLANTGQEANRIDFILSLRADQLTSDLVQRHDPNYIFLKFNEQLTKNVGQINDEWDIVKKVFLRLDEWYRDRYLYHVIGFLLWQKVKVSDIINLAQKAVSKTSFRLALKEEIFRKLFKPGLGELSSVEIKKLIDDKVTELSYESDKEDIRELLLLFNIVSLLEIGDSGPRFPFEYFKKDRWDLEHIRSVKSNMPERKDEQKAWLEHVLEYLSATEILEGNSQVDTQDSGMIDIMTILRDTEPFDEKAFEAIFSQVIDRYDPGSDQDVDNSIGNLTLLDATTNRGYGNAIFPHKRRKLISLDKAGKFVPLCTKNAFLKYYSSKIDEMLIWTHKDAFAHQAAIADSLSRFFAVSEVQL